MGHFREGTVYCTQSVVLSPGYPIFLMNKLSLFACGMEQWRVMAMDYGTV
jgi:hypothetical protein